MATEGNICRDRRGQRSPRFIDSSIAALAGRQHGVVARRQLAALGLGADAIDRRIGAGRLHPIHRGVYAVGHRSLTRHAVWMAAVLAAGAEAVLSHRSAAALWGIRHGERSHVEVIAPGRRRERRGLHAYRIVLPPDEVTHERGIPVTNVARTLLDLAAVVSQQQLEHALNEAEIRRLTSPLPLDALVARHPNRRGIAAIRRALDKQRQIGEIVTKSELERRFLAFIEAHGLPRPRTNVPLGPYEPDAVWPQHRVIVELDSYAIHTTRQAFEADRARDRQLQSAGYRVLRITWRQLHADPHAIAEELRGLVTAGPRPR